MKKQILKYIGILFAIMLIPALSGCNDTDDVQKIFTGKTWKMTYITKKGAANATRLSCPPESWPIFLSKSLIRFCGYERYMGSKWRKTNFPNNCKR